MFKLSQNELDKFKERMLKPIKFDVYHRNILMCHVGVDPMTQKVKLTKYWDKQPYQPFVKDNITMDDVIDFLKSRCFPRTRANYKEVLADLGLKEYDVWDITRVTRGLMYSDFTWIKYEGDDATYDDIKIRP